MDIKENRSQDAATKTVGAIDIGANAMRMVIAQVAPEGSIDVLERLQRAVRLGQDAFRRGRLGGESMRAAIAILRDYQKLLELYHVKRVRAVATTAVREASNADTFLDRIFMATGLQVEVIDPSEESRLSVSAVSQAVSGALGVDRNKALIVDVGGGSTLLTMLHNGQIVNSQSLRLGSILLQELLSTSEEPPDRSADLLRHYISISVSTTEGSLPMDAVESFVAIGGDARFAAREIGKPTESADLTRVDAEAFDRLIEHCESHTAEELSKQYSLPFAEAETLNPALLVYQNLLHRTELGSMIVSHVSMRDGLLLELAREVTGQRDETLLSGVIHSASALAFRYHADMDHAKNVAELADRLFDTMHSDHGLFSRYRLLLHVAALLHEIGQFVSTRAHHKHSYYLISNSEVFGLKRSEMEIIAQVARYHRRAAPRTTHIPYMALPRETRVVVTKLAALLRVADSLVRGRAPQASEMNFQREGDELIVFVPGGTDLLLEQRSIATKGDLFEDVFGMKIRLEES